MRFVTFVHEGEHRIGVVDGDQVVDLCLASGGEVPRSMRRFLSEGWHESQKLNDWVNAKGARKPLDELRLAAPLPEPRNIVCLGLNYSDHAAEGDVELPEKPLLFAKATSCVTGPYDPIVYNRQVERLDYEVELAFIIGRTARAVAAENAYEYIWGYTVFQDISARCAQFGYGQWFRGKSFDTFGPMGPWIVTRDEIPDPHRLDVRCAVNGEVRQESNTQYLHCKIPQIVEYVSSFMTLQPGDLISTGTPAGVGEFMDPPRLLKVGDVVETTIEGIGNLRNTVVAPDD